jgi:hypothetical protein
MKHVLHKVIEFFKESQADLGSPVHETDGVIATPKRAVAVIEQIADALKEAGSQFYYEHIKCEQQRWNPQAKFKLEQIVMVCNAENMEFLDALNSRNSRARERIVKAELAELGFDFSRFIAWRAVPSKPETEEAPFYATYARSKDYRIKLEFQFLGSIDDYDNTNNNAINTINTPNATPATYRKANATLLDEPPTPPSTPLNPRRAAQTLLDDAPRPLARLRMRYFDGTEAVHDMFILPFHIGREVDENLPHALVTEGCAKVSRVHLTFTALQAGAMVVTNPAAKSNGTYYQSERLSERFLITPITPIAANNGSNNQGGWHILGEKSLSENSVAIRLESVAS